MVEDRRQGAVERIEQSCGRRLLAGELFQCRKMPVGTGISPVIGQ